MQLARPARKSARESVIPMINVVFLLLVFFLISARLTPPMPVEVEAPEAAGADHEIASEALFVAGDGTPYWQGLSGEAALEALSARGDEAPLTLRADKALDGEALARLLGRIGVSGGAVYLVVEE